MAWRVGATFGEERSHTKRHGKWYLTFMHLGARMKIYYSTQSKSCLPEWEMCQLTN